MRELIIGYGEIGKAVHKAICPNADTLDFEDDMSLAPTYSLIHICFPYSAHFEEEVERYIEKFEPGHIAIYSTVPIGTCAAIDARIVHTPVEGRHPHLAESLLVGRRWVGYNVPEEIGWFTAYYTDRDLAVEGAPSTYFTEALKLLSTAEYGVNLVMADYKKRIADALGMDYELTKQWNRDYNELYMRLDLPQFRKFVLDPPNGKIGGHCVVPNAEMLDAQYPDELLKLIKEMK